MSGRQSKLRDRENEQRIAISTFSTRYPHSAPSVTHHVGGILFQPARKGTTLVSAGMSCQPPQCSPCPEWGSEPKALAKCKRGIRAHVKTAYNQTVFSKWPWPIHGVIQSDRAVSSLSLSLSLSKSCVPGVRRVAGGSAGLRLANVKEHASAFVNVGSGDKSLKYGLLFLVVMSKGFPLLLWNSVSLSARTESIQRSLNL